MSDLLSMQRDGDVTTISITRPEIGNRVSDDMAAELAGMFDEAARDSRIIVFKNDGDDFCLGREVFGEKGELPEAYVMRQNIEVVFNLYGAFRNSQVPIIGVIQGKAIGFGCALAALCDISICSDNAQFQLPETAHGIMPTMAMSALTDRIGRKALLYLVYSADIIDAAQAVEFGLASKVVPHAELDAAADELVEKMKKIPMPAMMAVKEYATGALGQPQSVANSMAKNLHATINSSTSMRE